MKRCSRCGEEKPFELFSLNKQTKDGRFAWCKPCAKETHKEWVARNKERSYRYHRNKYLKAKYGITIEVYEELLDAQGGACAICRGQNDHIPRNAFVQGVFYVDHDHRCCPGKETCGKCIRGLLCAGCNFGLSQFKDNEEFLMRAIEYLRGKVEAEVCTGNGTAGGAALEQWVFDTGSG